jgi:hypothetical protein
MKTFYFLLAFAIYSSMNFAQNTITVMDSVIFHDGYAGLITTTVPAVPSVGIVKHTNDLFARKLTGTEIQSIGTTLQMNVLITALCDNYDRIGSVNMALVPIGTTTYTPSNVQHIELGRFITPFMNKNISPKSVPYTFNIDNVAMLLKDTSITNDFDIWVELQVFGVPYAANTQVAGCSGRNDVFMGRLQFVTNVAAPIQNTNVLLPLYFKNTFNNYQSLATDTIGKTTKTLSFNVPVNLTDASLFLITSNHGANSGGEEYNRRFHYAYFDNALKLTYKPGRLTCEPFRTYNTQGNGIYGSTVKTPAQWQSFSNWCPGDVIDIRQIALGPLTAGTHTFTIRVPTAVFAAGQGDIPLSLYFQGKTSGLLTSINNTGEKSEMFSIFPNPANDAINVKLDGSLINHATIELYDVIGKLVTTETVLNINTVLDVHSLAIGIYTVRIVSEGSNMTKRIIKE